MKSNKFLIQIVIESIFCIKIISSDCGLPAIPFNAQINENQVKHNYLDGDSIEYHCELEKLKLVGPSPRQCRNGQWIGAIPRCVEESDFKKIGGIEIVDTENHTLLYDRTVVYFANYRPDDCLMSTEMTRPHTWKLLLTEVERHISYIEIQVSNKNNKLDINEAKDIINFVKVNDLRECESHLMQYSNETFRINLTCSLEFDLSTERDDWDKDETDHITFEVNQKSITICEIKIYKTSHKVHHWCGSADTVPYSRREFIRKNSEYAGNSHYRYYCNEGFNLKGNQDVRCGVDNNWLDEFPICKPVITCAIKPLTNGTLRHFVNTIKIEGIITAVIGSVVYYFCEEDPNHKSIMIGSTLRVCDIDAEWSGVNPFCIPEYKLEDFLEHIEEINENWHQFDSQTINDILSADRREDLSCGIPAMPLLAKPITQPKNKHLNRHSDLRPSYPNGTVIGYQCESAYALVAGDMEERTCINGKWVGKLSKCAIDLGNELLLNSITLSHLNEHGESIIINIDEVNNTNFEHFNQNSIFRFDPSKGGQCYNFVADKKQRWTLRLDKQADISYFMVMLHPGGFFNSKKHVTEPEILRLSPLSAKVNEKQCLLTSAWDYNQSKIGTYFHFTCDLNEQQSSFIDDFSQIILEIDPDQINKDYKTKSISLCSLAVFTSKNKCGTPDIPLHCSVIKNPLVQTWTYSCDMDYELVGQSTVKCGLNGRWMNDFPTCRKKEACTINDQYKGLSGLQIEYKNLMTIDGKNISVLDSVANYSCEQSSQSKALLIGSKLRVCNWFNGFKWSGSEPFCLDPKDLSKTKAKNNLNVKIAVIVGCGIAFMLFIGVTFLIVRRMNMETKQPLDNNNIDSPYTL